MTCARHVYHAGSRVGADQLGCTRKFQPRESPRIKIVRAMDHQVPRMRRRPPSAGVCSSGMVTISSVAMVLGFPSSESDPGGPRTPAGYGTHVALPRSHAQITPEALFASGKQGRSGSIEDGKTAAKTGSFSWPGLGST